MQIEKLNTTRSFCPKCLKVIDAEIVKKDNKIYLQSLCPGHSRFVYLHKWTDPKYYSVMTQLTRDIKRSHAGLLIDVNFDCNQNCNFCYAQIDTRREKMPTLSEIISKVENFKGVYVTLSGGEPTLRGDLPIIIQELKKRKFIVILATNGKKLIDRNYVYKLKKSGLDIVQLQFDTLDDQQYRVIRNEKLVDIKLQVVRNLKREKIFVYLWVAIVKDINSNQLTSIINYAAQNSSIIKVVYLVPMWLEGKILEHDSLSATDILKSLGTEYGINDKEFIEYAIFDYYTSAIYQKLTKTPFFKYVPCTISCHFLYTGGLIKPLSGLVNFKKVNYQLKMISNLISQGRINEKIKLLLKISYFFLIKEFLLNKKLRPFTIATLRSIFLFLVNKSIPMTTDNSFQVRIEAFFDRFNTDFSMLEQCNLYAYFKDELVPLCQREIIRKRFLG